MGATFFSEPPNRDPTCTPLAAAALATALTFTFTFTLTAAGTLVRIPERFGRSISGLVVIGNMVEVWGNSRECCWGW